MKSFKKIVNPKSKGIPLGNPEAFLLIPVPHY